MTPLEQRRASRRALPPEAALLVRDDGAVVVPAHLAGPVLRMAVSELQRAKSGTGGAQVTEPVLLLLWALRIAELRHDEVDAASTSARGSGQVGRSIVGDVREDRVVRSSEAAVLLGCSDRHVRALCRAGRLLGARKVGRDWLIPSDALDVRNAA